MPLHGKDFQKAVRMDNGPEFISEKMSLWAEKNQVELKFIQPENRLKTRLLKDSTELSVLNFSARIFLMTSIRSVRPPLNGNSNTMSSVLIRL
jgi:hypothetical protein